MKIKNIKLNNFQGIKDLAITVRDSVSIFGDNGTGKSTIANAVSWLLFGCANNGEKNYTPKTTDTHSLNHVAEIAAEHGGVSFKLKKDFHEVYKTKRGSAVQEFAGHTCDYYFDDVLVSEREYQDKLKNLLADSDTLKILVNPFYFCEELSIKDRRNILIEKIGGVTDAEVITANADLKEVEYILDGKTLEDRLKMLKVTLTNTDKEVKAIPARVDEANRAIPEITADKADLETEKQALESQLTEVKTTLNNSDSAAKAEIEQNIAKLKLDLTNAEAIYMQDVNGLNAEVNSKLYNVRDSISELKTQVSELKNNRADLETKIKSTKIKRQNLLAEWEEVSAKEWTGETVCPTCGQALPAEQIEESKSKFNIWKSEKLEEIKEAGSEVSESVIAKLEEELAEVSNKLATTEESKQMLEELKQTLASKMIQPDFASTEKYNNIISKLNIERAKLDNLAESAKERNAGLVVEEQELKNKIAGINTELAKFDLAKQQKERIAELNTQLATLQKQGEEIKRQIYILEKFTSEKAKMLSELINKEFKTLKFRMFETQINGGIKDDCEPLIPCGDKLVPFKSANTGSRINAGIEVIEVLSKAYGLQMPIIIDNAESVTQIKAGEDTQLVKLIVSESDKTLRIE